MQVAPNTYSKLEENMRARPMSVHNIFQVYSTPGHQLTEIDRLISIIFFVTSTRR